MDLLRANTQRNGFAMIEHHEVALSDSAGTARFTVFEDGSGVDSFAPQLAGGRALDVTTATLDSLTAQLGDRVALVKLDVEGAEQRRSERVRARITRSAPLFIIEVEPDHLARQGRR
jgi:FkbM family methyltransferase